MVSLNASCDYMDGMPATGLTTGFDVFTTGTGGSFTHDAANKLFGTTCMKITSGTGVPNECYWSTSLGTVLSLYARFYLKITAAPAATGRLMQGMSTTSTAEFGFDLTAARLLVIKDASGGNAATGTVPIPLNQWVRIEMDLATFSTTTGNPIVRLYTNAMSTTPDETISATGKNVGTSANRFTLPTRIASYTTYVDEIAVSDVAQPGPYVSVNMSNPAYMNGYQRRSKSGLLVR